MKKILTVILGLCLLLCAAASGERAGDESFLLKIWDGSGLPVSYLRFDFYAGDEYRGYACATPDEGEDFYRCPYTADNPEELKMLRIVISYGKSDLAPEDAILQVMAGNPGEEHRLLEAGFVPECGATYEMKLVTDGAGGWQLLDRNET